MAASKRQMNWTPVVWTPSGGSASTATGVTNVRVAGGANFVRFGGDGDIYDTLVVLATANPTITITTADEIWLMGIAVGGRGTVAATHKDARGATGGNLTLTLTGAVADAPDLGGQHRQIGSGSINFSAESADGVTNPLSYSLA